MVWYRRSQPRRFLCLRASPLGSDAKLAMQLPFNDCRAAFTGDIDGFAAAMRDHFGYCDPDVLGKFGPITVLYWVFLVGEPPFLPPERVAYDNVMAFAGRTGILLRERFVEDMRLRVPTRETALTAYVLLDQAHAAQFRDQLADIDCSGGTTIVVSCPAQPFDLPPSRTLPESVELQPYERFIPATEIDLRVA